MFPRALLGVTYPLKCLLKQLFNHHIRPSLVPNPRARPSPIYVEMVAIVERLLNFAHTGNPKVIPSTLMGILTISRALLEHGFPWISKKLMIYDTNYKPRVEVQNWPVSPGTKKPLSGVQRSIELTYGRNVFMVSGYRHSRAVRSDDERAAVRALVVRPVLASYMLAHIVLSAERAGAALSVPSRWFEDPSPRPARRAPNARQSARSSAAVCTTTPSSSRIDHESIATYADPGWAFVYRPT